ncbi:PEP phosphonomutase [Actibacterium mucosum KCTC 23349]|uniref:PEP phosphonomutase n=2 Tax=Actibacterium TaxID=1433986 RepID=A0A037ZLX3_9RHOB|nr:PEP phosphonomutase [Actibacterium mucosum KCTC 23349]
MTKGEMFRALHKPGDPFILANAWDAGSAKMLAALGAPAIGTSSSAHAFTLGKPDGVTRDEALAHAQDLVAAVDVPVSGDWENGFGDDPDTCAETVRLAAEVGLAGISIEDTVIGTGGSYDFDLSVERIRAAAAAARALPQDFFLLARADGVLRRTYDVDEAMRRLQAFEAAGADGLYLILPPSLDDVARLCKTTHLPVNAIAAGPHARYTRADFAAIGVARISLGSALANATWRVIADAGHAMFNDGSFAHLTNGINGQQVNEMLTQK